MKNAMMTVADAAKRIEDGAVLLIAGDEAVLAALPTGHWIGGTSLYFVTDTGGRLDRDHVFVTEIDEATDARSVLRTGNDLPDLARDRYDSGITMILVPAFSSAHADFAIHGASYDGLFDQPLMGWVTGVHLDDIGTVSPKVFDGATGKAYDEGALLLHVALPRGAATDLDIVNIFEQDPGADTIVFDETGFDVTQATVNGQKVDFAAYVAENGIDVKLPLVANYSGAMINVSFRAVDASAGKVAFYAPVVAGVEYRLAKPSGSYAQTFAEQISGDGSTQLSCNCILNYLYGELEGETTGSYTGPATFGEIAYILLNQTMVRMQVDTGEQRAVA
ncbi:hypothetical protein [Pseudosulfitobacter sp. DSM 107133]|uniref:DUF6976 family protein n=1 Tax=Pseudosulfitobacter sp. DSM 107133 TaxID=2883100 RepID=UPI000DF3EE33|nr:hypothetical protein [Pseudosulfitobacter sp. DSM 107133]UOA30171.1 hypothetical protein DSM107133_04934 [Pseudosulfitobacter sp. DSM 107133]